MPRFDERGKEIIQLVELLGIQLRPIPLAFGQLALVMVESHGVVTQSRQSIGQTIRLLVRHVLCRKTEVHTVESRGLSGLTVETERTVRASPQPTVFTSRSVLQMQLGEVQCRTGLDIQFQLERQPLFPGDNGDRLVALDVHATWRRECEVEIDLSAFTKRSLAAG